MQRASCGDSGRRGGGCAAAAAAVASQQPSLGYDRRTFGGGHWAMPRRGGGGRARPNMQDTGLQSAPAHLQTVCQDGLDVHHFQTQMSNASQATDASVSRERQITDNSISDDLTSIANSAGPDSRQSTGIDKDLLKIVVNEVLLKQCIVTAVADCNFVVTIADPRAKDCPLIAVSEEFENLTGFQRSEILGVNCRFLSQGCDMDPGDLMALRESSRTGAQYTSVLPNRKKSGELFLNLLDIRGLTVAKNKRTGEDMWFLVGIQADVTDLAEEEVPLDHLQGLQRIAEGIRVGITQELSRMAMLGAAATMMEQLDPATPTAIDPNDWLLLEKPVWRNLEAPLRTRFSEVIAGKDGESVERSPHSDGGMRGGSDKAAFMARMLRSAGAAAESSASSPTPPPLQQAEVVVGGGVGLYLALGVAAASLTVAIAVLLQRRLVARRAS